MCKPCGGSWHASSIPPVSKHHLHAHCTHTALSKWHTSTHSRGWNMHTKHAAACIREWNTIHKQHEQHHNASIVKCTTHNSDPRTKQNVPHPMMRSTTFVSVMLHPACKRVTRRRGPESRRLRFYMIHSAATQAGAVLPPEPGPGRFHSTRGKEPRACLDHGLQHFEGRSCS